MSFLKGYFLFIDKKIQSPKRTFRVKENKRKKQAERQEKLKARLAHKGFKDATQPLLGELPIDYEISDRTRVLSVCGIGAMHTLVTKLALPELLNEGEGVLKRHLPYIESDHILSLCYSLLCGGKPLEDINRFRRDEVYLDALGVERLPAPSTAGDYLRRYESEAPILAVQEAINQARVKVWKLQEEAFFEMAILDVDGTITPTDAECMEGIDYCAHKRTWGYGPLVLTLAQTGEALYVVNRPASAPSHLGAAEWMDRAFRLVGPMFETVWFRGDTDFSLTVNFDRWDRQGAKFIFGYDAYPNLIEIAQKLPERAWKELRRPPKYEIQTQPRQKPDNVKREIIKERGFKHTEQVKEEVASFPYRPGKCKSPYRMIVLKKYLRITKGDQIIQEKIVFFFYITNDQTTQKDLLIFFINARCNQENKIEQLQNGVPAFHAPTNTLHANWIYMVIASLAWSLKIWYGLLIEDPKLQQQIVQMEFKQFLNTFIQVPCQILHGARRLTYRIANFTFDTLTFYDIFQHLQKLRFS